MFLVCGEALFDLFLENEQGPGIATYDARAGGSPFNVAVGLARLDQDAGLLTGISTDMLGQRLAQVLTNEGVSVSYAVRTDRPTTLSVVGLDSVGVPAYQFYDGNSAGTGLTIAELPEIGPEVTGFHFGSFSLAAAPVAEAFADLAFRFRDRFISLDPNIRANVIPDMGIWRQRLSTLYQHADLVKISTEDLELLHPGRSHSDFADGLLKAGVHMVVITDGAGPVRGWTSNGARAEVIPPTSEVVDTVGAGDSFQAALIAQILRRSGPPKDRASGISGTDFEKMLQVAARAAAITCSRRGADLPDSSALTE